MEAIVFDDSAVLAVHPTTVASVVDLGGVAAVGDHLDDAREGDVLEQEAGGARPGGGGRGSDDDYSSDCGKRRIEHRDGPDIARTPGLGQQPKPGTNIRHDDRLPT